VVCGCEAGGRTAKLSKTTLEAAYGREMNIELSGCSSGGHSCRQHVNYLKTSDICGIVLRDKMAHFRVAFYCPPAQGAPV
jgi:hypothetical protein